jgi:hypothetical protein
MSSSSHRNDPPRPDSPANYAPRRVRESLAERSATRRTYESDDDPALSAILSEWSRHRETTRTPAFIAGLQPELMQEPSGSGRSRSRMIFPIAAAAFIAATGLVAAGAYSYSQITPAAVDQTAKMASVTRERPLSTLTVENRTGAMNETLPLGLQVKAPTPGAAVYLKGVPRDALLTSGTLAAVGEWRIAVKDLPLVEMVPPRDYTGSMDLTAELREAGDRVVSSGSVHLTWTPPAPKSTDAAKSSTDVASPPVDAAKPPVDVAKSPPPEAPRATANSAAPDAVRKIPPAELAALIKRGEDLASSGDLPAARLLLQRAAETHDARAAFVLATTYDPIVVKRLAPNSSSHDVALARSWYEKARDWGSREAPQKLEALASTQR